jgi:glycosyltransferase involved in cell wall biosynthesis
MVDRVVVINDFSSNSGGAAALALASAIWLRERGHNVTFISGDRGQNHCLTRYDIDVVSIAGSPLLSCPRRSAVAGLFDPRTRRSIKEWIAQYDTEGTIYHLHNWSQILSPSIFSALRDVSDRVVVSAHDFFLVCPNGAYANYKTGSVCPLTPLSPACLMTDCDSRRYSHKLWRSARQVVVNALRDLGVGPPVLALHEGMVPFLERGGIPSKSIEVVRNPVVPFTGTRVAAEGNRQFVFVGRLHSGKGPDLAAAAARAAGAPLKLIGDGPLRPSLVRDYPEALITGWGNRPQVAEWISAARAIIVPSRYPEPFGLVPIEAIWSGLPVIIASSALLAPEIDAAGAGRSCDPHDIAAMADVIRVFANDDDLIREMSYRGFSHSGNLATSPDQWIDQLERVYRRQL